MRTGDVLECIGRRWRAERTIGSGHTATVWLLVSEDGSSNERLVAKCIRPPRPGSVGRGMSPADFVAETLTLHRLLAAEGPLPRERSRFPWVYACDPERRHFVMEFASGVALRDIVGVRLLTVEQILALTIQLIEALAATVRAGLRNTDLKLDAILWDAEAERLVILDWNVCRERRPADDTGWLPPEVAFVAALLDGVLLHAAQGAVDSLPDWSRPFERVPERWGSYLRVFQRVLTALAEQPEARTLDGLRLRLVAIADALARQPEALLSTVKRQVAHARAAPRTHRAELTEAAAFAELAVAARRHAVALRARLLMGEALELLGRTAPSLETLRATAVGVGDEALVAPGDGVVLHRLRRFARVRVAALGIGRPLTEALEACEDQQWRVAADRLHALLERFAQSAELAADLQALLDESRGLATCLEGLRALDEADRLGLDGPRGEASSRALDELERRRALLLRGVVDLERGLATLQAVPWSAALMGMLTQLPRILAHAREAIGPTPVMAERPRRVGASRSAAARAAESGADEPHATPLGVDVARADASAASGPSLREAVDGSGSSSPSPPTPPRRRSPALGGRRDLSVDAAPAEKAHGPPAQPARPAIRRPRPLPRAPMAREAALDRLTLVDVPSPHRSKPVEVFGFTDDMAADFDMDVQTEVFVPPGPRAPRVGSGAQVVQEPLVPEVPEVADDPWKNGRPGDRTPVWVLLAAVAVGAGGIWLATRPSGDTSTGSGPAKPVVAVPLNGLDRGIRAELHLAPDVRSPRVEDAEVDAEVDADAEAATRRGSDTRGSDTRGSDTRGSARARRAARKRPPRPVAARVESAPARPGARSPTGQVQDEDRPDAPAARPTAVHTPASWKTRPLPVRARPVETGDGPDSDTPTTQVEDRPQRRQSANRPPPIDDETSPPNRRAARDRAARAGRGQQDAVRGAGERRSGRADGGTKAPPAKWKRPRDPALPSEMSPRVDDDF